ncbi:hypothetical protein D3C80_1522680 [compost metagenome]
MVMPILCGNANAQNASSNASQSGRRISMNCGNGDTLSSNPMANVSQTTQPFFARAPTISASPFVWLPQRRERSQALPAPARPGLKYWSGMSPSAQG